MSLFQLKDWWTCRQGDGVEEFDQASLCIGNVDNSAAGRPKIVTGSFAGVLRIVQPTQSAYSPSHVLLERQQPEPILQVALGCFCNPGQLLLAVLHPRALAIHLVTQPDAADAEVPPFLEVQQLHRHLIPHAAANMCHGAFGGGPRGQHGILVQALDGQLYVFEGGQQVHVTFFDDFLMPGPLAYIPATDSFVTCASSYELHSYTYASIIQASQTKAEASAAAANGGGLSSKRCASPQWRLLVGELAVDIQVGAGGSDIIVVGEHTLLVCSERGALKSQRRLDYHPAAATSYKLPSGESNLVVATHTRNVLVYAGNRVAWLAKGPTIPVAVRVARVGPLDAALVMLDDEGMLSVCYLGTAPPTSVLGLSEGREPDWEQVQARRKELARIIREKSGAAAGGAAPRLASEQLCIRTEVPSCIADEEDAFGECGASARRSDAACRVRVYLSAQGNRDLHDVELCVETAWPICVDEPVVSVGTLRGGRSTPQTVLLELKCGAEALPCSTQVPLTATCEGPSGRAIVAHHALEAPLALCVTMVPPLKSAAARLTVTLDREPPALLALFDDVAKSSPSDSYSHSSAGSVLSFRYHGGEDCSVLASNSSSKLRLQGSSLAALSLLLAQLVQRLQAACGGARVRIGLEEGLPVRWYQGCIEAHFSLRKQRRVLLAQLEQAAEQFRTVQKALLSHLKEAKPTPSGPLPALLEASYAEIVEVAERVESTEASLQAAGNTLACGTQLMRLGLRCRCQGLPEDALQPYLDALSPEVHSGDDIGWEEVTAAALAHLIAEKSPEAAVQPVAGGTLPQCETLTHYVDMAVKLAERAAAEARSTHGP